MRMRTVVCLVVAVVGYAVFLHAARAGGQSGVPSEPAAAVFPGVPAMPAMFAVPAHPACRQNPLHLPSLLSPLGPRVSRRLDPV